MSEDTLSINTHQLPSLTGVDHGTSITSSGLAGNPVDARQEPTSDVPSTHGSPHGRAFHAKYRLSIFHLCNCIPGFVVAISKYSLNLHNKPLTVNELDLVMGVIQFVLFLIGRYECPPLKLRWFLDTEWECILKLVKKSASAIYSHFKKIQDPFGFWICLLMSIAFMHSVISLAWIYSPSLRDHFSRSVLVNGLSALGIIGGITVYPLWFGERTNDNLSFSITSIHVIVLALTAMAVAIVVPSGSRGVFPSATNAVLFVAPTFGLMLTVTFWGLSLMRLNLVGSYQNHTRKFALLVAAIDILVSLYAIAVIAELRTSHREINRGDLTSIVTCGTLFGLIALGLFLVLIPVKVIIGKLRVLRISLLHA